MVEPTVIPGLVYCPYEKRNVPVEKCRECDKKEGCPSLSGW